MLSRPSSGLTSPRQQITLCGLSSPVIEISHPDMSRYRADPEVIGNFHPADVGIAARGVLLIGGSVGIEAGNVPVVLWE